MVMISYLQNNCLFGSPYEIAGPDVPPPSVPPSSIDRKKDGVPAAEPPYEIPKPLPPVSGSPTKGTL